MSRVSINQMIGILQGFGTQADQSLDSVPEEILTSIRRWIIITGTIDTGDLYVDFNISEYASNVGHNFLIENLTGYEGFTEFPRPAYDLDGRYYFQHGIEDFKLEPVADEMVRASFR